MRFYQPVIMLLAASAFAQNYTPTPRTLSDYEVGLILQSLVSGQAYNSSGYYGIGYDIENPNTVTQFNCTAGGSVLPCSSLKGEHGVLQHLAAGADHVDSFDPVDGLQAYEADEILAGRPPLQITSGGNPVYWDNSTAPYGKRPMNICDPRYVRWYINEKVRRRSLTPSNPGTGTSPQYPGMLQSLDEGFFLGPQTTSGVYGFPGGVSDGVAWDQPFPQTQAAWTACAASFFSQAYAIAPDVSFTLNQGSLAEPNGTVNNNDLSLFKQIYNSSPKLSIDRETFWPYATGAINTEVFYNVIQNQSQWLLTTGRTAVWRQLVDGTAGQIESGALSYLMAKEGNSFFSEASGSTMVDPANSTFAWGPVFDQLGNPLTAATVNACTGSGHGTDYSNVWYSRQFEGGWVYINFCGASQSVTLPAGTWSNSAGSVVTTLTLGDLTSGLDTLIASYVTATNFSSQAAVQKPQISPLGNGTISGAVTATITDGSSGATIHYTTNGTTPTCSSATYSTPLAISSTTTLEAIACKTGAVTSWEDKTTYTITATAPSAQFALANDAATPFFPITYAAITLSNPSSGPITVNYTITGDSNITFSPSSGTVTFAAFETALAIPIQASLASTVATDSITATITSGTGYTAGSQSSYTYTITRNLRTTVTNTWTELHPSAFGMGRSDIAANNSNTATEILAGVNPATPADFRMLWQFPLTPIPSNATINKATILGYIPTYTDAGATQITTKASRVLNSWSQSTVDWSNFLSTSSNWSATPTATTNAIASNVTGNSSTALSLNTNGNHFNVTADVQAMVAGTETNNGWVLIGPEASAGTEEFYWLTSNSANSPESQASLYVAFSTPAPPSVTLDLPAVSTAYCTITAGSPATLAGTQCPLSVTLGNAPSVASVEYVRDGSVIAGTEYGEREATIRTAPYAYVFDTFYFGNGQHTLIAIARDITNAILAVSNPVSIQVENNLPQNTCSTTCTDISVTTGEYAQMSLTGSVQAVTDALLVHGAGKVSLVGSVHVGSGSTGTLNLPSFTSTAGNFLTCFARWQSASQTISVTDNNGDTFVGETLVAGSGFSAERFNVNNIAGGAGTVITAASSGGAQVSLMQCKELTGQSSSSPIDQYLVTAATSTSAPAPPIFNLGFPAANEFVDIGSSWAGVSTATATPGYTLTQDATKQSATEYINPPAGVFGLEAITVTVNGPKSSVSKTFRVWVDGCLTAYANPQQACGATAASVSGVTAASNTTIISTAEFANAPHNVVVQVTGSNCAGCNNGAWDIMGEWEQQQTFANGSAASQLLMTYHDVTLCVTATTNCPSSITETATVQNADGTTGTASSYSWTINYASVGGVFPSSAPPITLSSTTSSSATVAAVAGMQNNSTSVTVTAVTASGTLSRTFWVKIPPDAVGAYVPHFNTSGQFVTNGVSSTDIRAASAFFSGGNGFNPFGLQTTAYPPFVDSPITSAFNYQAQYGPLYAAAGFNLLECGVSSTGGATEAQYDAYAQSLVANAISLASANGLAGCHLIGDSWERGTPVLFDATTGPASLYSTPLATYYINQASSQGLHIVGSRMVDEVSSIWPANPFAGIATGGIFPYSGSGPNPNGFVSIDCTVSPAVLNVTAGVWGGLIGSSTFIVHGSAASDASAINYNFTSGNAQPYLATGTSSSTYTFPRPTGCTTLHNFANDPTIQIEPLVAYNFASAANSFAACPGSGGGSFAGPCPNYTVYNAIYLLRQQILAATTPFKMATPVASGGLGFPVSCWGGKTVTCPTGLAAGDYDFVYWSGGGAYLADHGNLTDLINSQGNIIRARYEWNNLGAPTATEVLGVVQDYMAQGYPISVASCSGNAITTTMPHAVYNIVPGITRVSIQGSSGANCDTPTTSGYYIFACPTSTTCNVTLANTTTTVAGTGGTITFFPSGASYTLSIINSSTQVSGATSNHEASFSINGTQATPLANHRGETFTISGNSQSVYNYSTSGFVGYFQPDTLNSVSNGLTTCWYRQLANINPSTGGTAQIIKNHYLIRGDAWPSDGESGARNMFASNIASLIWGTSQISVYQENGDPDAMDLTLTGSNNSLPAISGYLLFGVTNFNCNYTACPQAGIDPRTDYAKSFAGWVAHTNANLMATREIPFAFGQRLPAPDYGQFFEAAAWTSPRGNLLAIQSFADNNATLTANLSPFLEAGQQIYRICAEWNTIKTVTAITSGTAADTYNYAPGEHCAYMFAKNAAVEIQQPQLSVRLADVANAAKVVVQFSYARLAFQEKSSAGAQTLYQTQDCGNAAACLLNVDRSIGTVYYRLLYLNSSNAVIATSDIQTL